MTVPQHEGQKGEMAEDGEERTVMVVEDHRERRGGGGGEENKVCLREGGGDDIKPMPTPPDGGWGWVVVFASFMIHVLADGFTYTFGIYFVQLVQYYDASAAATSWIASILVGVTLGSGPIAGILVNKFGCRVVTIMGALLASVSLFLSIFAPNVETLYFTIGLGAGLGFGLIYLPAIVCVTGYFEKRRSFATGIAVCGSGIGTFAFSPMIESLIHEYSWQNSLIVVSGIMLNCVVFGALFRPLEDDDSELSQHPGPMLLQVETPTTPTNNTMPLKALPTFRLAADELKKNYSAQHLPQRVSEHNGVPRISSHGNISPMLARLSPATDQSRMAVSQPLLANAEDGMIGAGGVGAGKSGSLPPSHHGSRIFDRKDIFYHGSLLNIPEYKQDPGSYRASICRFQDADETPSEVEKAKVCGCIPCGRDSKDALNSLMDWGLLTDGIFILFALSNFCTSIGFNAPYIFIVDRARHLGIPDSKSSLLLSVVGISNTVSRILLGYISDQPWVNRLYLYNISLTLCGLGTCVSIWFYDYTSQILYAIVFGSMSGAYVGLTSVVLVDLLGMDRLTNAFGLLLMFQGIASLIGPPICGTLFDKTNSYDYSFLLAGTMIAISGVMLFFIPCIWRIQARKLARRAANTM